MKQASPTFAEIRRRDRAVTEDAWLRAFLTHAPVGILATSLEAQPLINSNLFVYDEVADVIYVHTARTGGTRDAIDRNPRVCFHVMEMGRVLPADRALEFSVEYAGVTVFGSASVVEDSAEAKAALQKLLDKYAPHLKPERDYEPTTDADLKRTAVYRVEVERWSGKRKAVAEDFVGAFWYRAPSALLEAKSGISAPEGFHEPH